MQIQPKQKLEIKRRDGKGSWPGSLVHAQPEECSVLLPAEAALFPGDAVEMQVPRREDALYVFHATVQKAEGRRKGIFHRKRVVRCSLKDISLAKRQQRRASERITATLAVDYAHPPPGKNFTGNMNRGVFANLSSTGALLMAESTLARGSEILLSFQLGPRWSQIPVVLLASVVREHPPDPDSTFSHPHHGYGVQFKTPLEFPRS